MLGISLQPEKEFSPRFLKLKLNRLLVKAREVIVGVMCMTMKAAIASGLVCDILLYFTVLVSSDL